MNFFLLDCIILFKLVVFIFYEFVLMYSFFVVNDRNFFNINFLDFMYSYFKNLIDFVFDFYEKRELVCIFINNVF